jgi:FOG: HEAT repeat
MTGEALSDAQERLATLQAAVASAGRDQAIVAGLKDAYPLVRQNAIALAARYLAPEVLAEFLADDEDAILRNAARSALERQGPHAIAHLLGLTRGPNHEVAFFAVQILSTINDVSAKQALLPLLDHSDRNIAQAVVEALGHMRAQEAVPALIRLLAGDPWLQFAAASALGRIGDARAVGPLLDRLDDEVLAEMVVEALGRIGDAAALAPLLDRLVASDRLPLRDQLLLAVAAILEHNPGLRGLPERARLWRPEVRAGLGEYLGGLLAMHDAMLARSAGVLVVHAELWELMPALFARHPEPGEECWLGGMLGRRRRRARVEWLPFLQHPDPSVRAGVLLHAPFGAGAGPAVVACLQDKDPEVRAAACLALGRLREPSAALALARVLRSGDAREYEAAARALAQLPRKSLAELAPDLQSGAGEERIQRALAVLELARLRVIRILQQEETGSFFLAQAEGANLADARNLNVTSAKEGGHVEAEANAAPVEDRSPAEAGSAEGHGEAPSAEVPTTQTETETKSVASDTARLVPQEDVISAPSPASAEKGEEVIDGQTQEEQKATEE